MAYVTTAEYKTITGEAAPIDFSVLSDISDGIIDTYTLYGLVGRTLSALPIFIQTNIKKAAALQIQYLDKLGGLSAVNEQEHTSASLGKFSFSNSSGGEKQRSPLLDELLCVVCAYLRGVS